MPELRDWDAGPPVSAAESPGEGHRRRSQNRTEHFLGLTRQRLIGKHSPPGLLEGPSSNDLDHITTPSGCDAWNCKIATCCWKPPGQQQLTGNSDHCDRKEQHPICILPCPSRCPSLHTCTHTHTCLHIHTYTHAHTHLPSIIPLLQIRDPRMRVTWLGVACGPLPELPVMSK